MLPVRLTLSENVRQLRKQFKITQASLAKQIGISRTKLYEFETGVSYLNNSYIKKISDVFHVEYEYLFFPHQCVHDVVRNLIAHDKLSESILRCEHLINLNVGQPIHQGLLYSLKGKTYSKMGDIPNTLRSFEHMWDCVADGLEPNLKFLALYNIAACHFMLKNYDECLDVAKRAEKFANDLDVVDVRYLAATVSLNRGDYEDSFLTFCELEGAYREHGVMNAKYISVLNNIAFALQNMGYMGQASDTYKHAYNMASSLGDYVVLNMVTYSQVELLIARKQYDTALTVLGNSLQDERTPSNYKLRFQTKLSELQTLTKEETNEKNVQTNCRNNHTSSVSSSGDACGDGVTQRVVAQRTTSCRRRGCDPVGTTDTATGYRRRRWSRNPITTDRIKRSTTKCSRNLSKNVGGGYVIIDGIQLEIDVYDWLAGHGLAKLRDGHNIMACCPFHAESSPSFGVNRYTGVYNCFGCGARGSFPQLVAHLDGYDTAHHAAVHLITHYGKFQTDVDSPLELRFVDDLPDNPQVQHSIPESTLDPFRYRHPYMDTRHISTKWQRLLEVGYCKRTRAITFPYRDHVGTLQTIKFRKVGAKQFWYDPPLPGRIKAELLWGLHAALRWKLKTIALTEAEIDAISVWQSETVGAAAVGGNQLTDEQATLLKRVLPSDTELVAFTDNDDGGELARRLMVEKLGDTFTLTRVDYGLLGERGRHIKDANDCGTDEIRYLLERRVPMGLTLQL